MVGAGTGEAVGCGDGLRAALATTVAVISGAGVAGGAAVWVAASTASCVASASTFTDSRNGPQRELN